MATILFIHGTGVRRADYEKTLRRLEAGLRDQKLADLRIEGCLWGDPLGTKLEHPLSIPRYAESGGARQSSAEELDVELWMNLYADPLYELRVMSLRGPEAVELGGVSRGKQLDDFARGLVVDAALAAKLEQGDILRVFSKARDDVIGSQPYREMLDAVSDPMGPFQDALARAIVAQAIHQVSPDDSDPDPGLRPAVQVDARLRNDVVALIRDQLGPYQAAVGEWIVGKLLGTGKAIAMTGLATLGTPIIRWRRGKVMDGTSPVCGDILLYQCRGNPIRALIHSRIREVTPPVILIAHSLGGVASVDLLIEQDLHERVRLLVTVGSQAPYFYEINALHSLARDGELPLYFPRWINVYDLRDFLSFVGAELFHGRVVDQRVDNRQPFPESHGAYFWNRELYSILAEAIRRP